MRSRLAEDITQASRELLRAGRDQSLPVDPFKLAPLRRIQEVIREPSNRDGMLIPRRGGFVVRINSNASLSRQRYAMAHELAHTFLYDISKDPPAPTQDLGGHWRLEGLCHLAAEEILVPEWATDRLIQQWSNPSIRSYLDLMDRFQVSADVLGHRLRRLNAGRVVIIIWAKVPAKDGSPALIPTVFRPKRLRRLGLQRIKAPDSVRIARTTRLPSLSEEEWLLKTGPVRLLSESCPLDHGDSRFLTLVYAELSEDERLALKGRHGEQLSLIP